MLLFNLYRNSRHGTPAGQDYPLSARVNAAPSSFAGTIRRSVIGLDFQTPQAVFGGQFRGSLFVDMSIGDALSNIQPRLRTVSVEGRWQRWALLAGQEKPIFSPREPTSLAQVIFSPLAGAGNFWLWRPQLRMERTVALGKGGEIRARIGVSQAPETGGTIPPEILATVESRRPALEGHFQFAYQMDGIRRFEIGSGFHRSATHAAGTSIPADLISLDWFVRPVRWTEFTGAIFTGENMSKGGSTGGAQGVALMPLGPGRFQVVPVGRRGGWAQLTFLPTSRLSLNLQAGLDDIADDYLISTSISRNTALIVNTFFRVAQNVVWGVELGQLRTRFKAGLYPRYNHHDFYVAYLF